MIVDIAGLPSYTDGHRSTMDLRPHPLLFPLPLRGPQRTIPVTPIPASWCLVLLVLLSATAPLSHTALSPASTTTSLKVVQHAALPAPLLHLP
jgi:hypothetical protein